MRYGQSWLIFQGEDDLFGHASLEMFASLLRGRFGISHLLTLALYHHLICHGEQDRQVDICS